MYATLDDLKKQLPEDLLIQLTDDLGTGIINTLVADAALETADVEINGYLGGRYTLPLSPLPRVIVKLAVDISIYNLYARRQGPPEHWQKRYDNTVRFLVKIAGGQISLGVGDPEPPVAVKAVVSASDRIFTRKSMRGY